MEEHTLELLDKLYKKDLVQIVLTLQNKLKSSNDEVLQEIRKLNIIFQKLESDISITKNTNSLLLKRVVELERECWENAQYSRRECLELVGIPASVSHDTLENTVLNIFDEMGCQIQKENIEACHRISKHNDRTIMKFARRKDCQQVLSVKRDLKKLSLEDIGLPEKAKIFINQSLCPYYRILWSKCKKLHSLDKIHTFYVSNGTFKIKISENGQPISITHTSDFDKYFPGVDLSPDN